MICSGPRCFFLSLSFLHSMTIRSLIHRGLTFNPHASSPYQSIPKTLVYLEASSGFNLQGLHAQSHCPNPENYLKIPQQSLDSWYKLHIDLTTSRLFSGCALNHDSWISSLTYPRVFFDLKSTALVFVTQSNISHLTATQSPKKIIGWQIYIFNGLILCPMAQHSLAHLYRVTATKLLQYLNPFVNTSR